MDSDVNAIKNRDGDLARAAGEKGSENIPQTLGFKLRRLQLAYSRYFLRQAPQSAIPTRQLGTLALICRNPGLTPSALKGLLLLDAAQLTAIIRQLEARSFIRRENSSTDSRSYILFATESGLAEYNRIHDIVVKFEEEFVGSALTEAERTNFIAIIDRLLASWKA